MHCSLDGVAGVPRLPRLQCGFRCFVGRLGRHADAGPKMRSSEPRPAAASPKRQAPNTPRQQSGRQQSGGCHGTLRTYACLGALSFVVGIADLSRISDNAGEDHAPGLAGAAFPLGVGFALLAIGFTGGVKRCSLTG